MQSPLPDSSALEAGILEDVRPPYISRVQDNVRNLLRNSVLSSIRGSTTDPTSLMRHYFPHPPPPNLNQQRTSTAAMPSPLRPHHPPPTPATTIEPVLPSPSSSSYSSSASTSTSDPNATSSPDHNGGIPGILFPVSVEYTRAVQQMAHQSTLFNTRAVAALDHPDLSDPSMAVFLQQKSESRQQRAWKRARSGCESGHGEERRRRRKRKGSLGSRWWVCLISALGLAALVATYLAFATTASHHAVFHVLFILGILCATVIFIHTVVRMCLFNRGLTGSAPFFLVAPPPKQHRRHHGHSHRRRHHQHHHRRPREGRERPDAAEREYIPSSPIRVCLPVEDEVRPDSREAQPSAGATQACHEGESNTSCWDKDVEALANPPPAYGRWRGSVRANPDLLHWAPSPTTPHTPSLPSPTYEEAMRGALPVGSGGARGSAVVGSGGPPSYKTKESPVRPAGARPVVEESGESAGPALVVEPEMVEGRGIGVAE